ncbi:MAG: universal stress protein [Acidimicrobiales bacterium]
MVIVNVLFSPLARSGNAAAIERVTGFAAQHHARLTLLGVVPEPSRLQLMLQSAEDVRSAVETAVDDLESELQQWCRDPVVVDREGIVAVGDPTTTILEHLRRGHADLLAVTADAGRIQDPAIRRLLHLCPTPVWVMKPPHDSGHGVVAAVDADPDEFDLNMAILDQAVDLHRLVGGELHVVHAWEFYAEAQLRHSAFIHPSGSTIDAMLGDEHDEHLARLESLIAASPHADAPWVVHLLRGRPDEVITRFIDDHGIDLVVLGTIARRGLPGLVIGNTADRVLAEAPCSMLAIKPPWFEATW